MAKISLNTVSLECLLDVVALEIVGGVASDGDVVVVNDELCVCVAVCCSELWRDAVCQYDVIVVNDELCVCVAVCCSEL